MKTGNHLISKKDLTQIEKEPNNIYLVVLTYKTITANLWAKFIYEILELPLKAYLAKIFNVAKRYFKKEED